MYVYLFKTSYVHYKFCLNVSTAEYFYNYLCCHMSNDVNARFLCAINEYTRFYRMQNREEMYRKMVFAF